MSWNEIPLLLLPRDKSMTSKRIVNLFSETNKKIGELNKKLKNAIIELELGVVVSTICKVQKEIMSSGICFG